MSKACVELERPAATVAAPQVALTGSALAVRVLQPISVGVAWPRGHVRKGDALEVQAGDGASLLTQWEALDTWPDGSVRWALVDFIACLPAGVAPDLRVTRVERTRRRERGTNQSQIHVERQGEGHMVRTGAADFHVAADSLLIEWREARSGVRLGPTLSCSLETLTGAIAAPRRRRAQVEAMGPVRATLRLEADLQLPGSRARLEVDARLSFFAGTGLIKIELTLRNPRAASHPGGCWDLGDAGSVLFRDFSIALDGAAEPAAGLSWQLTPGAPTHVARGPALEIYQASSGGDGWRSRNHVNSDGAVVLPFRGYRARLGATEEVGQRAQPVVAVEGRSWRAVAAVEQFWQQFPKALEATRSGIHIRLFPRQHPGGHELQGGEQKTHTTWVLLSEPGAPEGLGELAWVASPLRLSPSPEALAASGALPCIVPAAPGGESDCMAMARCAVEGERSFFAKREVIDEYGWRSFGDVYADHENRFYEGPRPLISHYNNQYDLIWGLLTQHALSGDGRWRELGEDLARHVIDIDVYHTQEDKPAYSGGLFWHTDHYSDAQRSTHRTYSRLQPHASRATHGGGPSCEHNYTSGLLLYHLLTGDPRARETVLGLADWVLRMDDGSRSLLGALDSGPTGCASSTHEPSYHGPGRGPGNSIGALLNAFVLSRGARYLAKAEELVRRCIHPRDDIAARNLIDPESRWSYLVFLQALGGYLDLKAELGQRDESFAYARASLVAYATWMHEHEKPYVESLDRVEYPTETWAAHDLRKSVVFDYAALHAPPEWRERFRQKAVDFFAAAIRGMRSFDSWSDTRPMAILMQNGPYRARFASRARDDRETELPARDWGTPTAFVPQRERVRRLLRTPGGVLRAGLRLASPRRLLQLGGELCRELRQRRRR